MKFASLLIITTALQLLVSVGGLPIDSRSSVEWRDIIELARNKTGLPGMSVAVLHKGKLIFAEGFGKRNKHDPVTAEVCVCVGFVNMCVVLAVSPPKVLTKQACLL